MNDASAWTPEDRIDAIVACGDSYIRLGWVLILNYPAKSDGSCTCKAAAKCVSPGKHPIGPKWTSLGIRSSADLRDQLTREYQRLGFVPNLGVVTGAMSGVIVVDVDCEAELQRLEAELGELSPNVAQKSGGGRRQLFFRAPPGVKIPSKSRWGAADKSKPGVDTRGDGGQTVVPPSVHATGGTYAWEPGQAPWDAELTDLPASWITYFTSKAPAQARTSDGEDSDRVIYDEEDVPKAMALLWRLPPVVADDYDDWIAVGMALHNVCGGDPRGLAAWDLWSQQSQKHKLGECAEKWATFNPNREKAVGLNRLADLVRQYENTGRPKSASERPPISPSGARAPVLICMADVSIRPVEWLWPGRIPRGKLSIITGDPSLGKSLITVDMAARISTGRGWPDGTDGPSDSGSVLILSAEDDPGDTIAPRLKAAGANMSHVHVLSTIRDARGKLTPFTLADLDMLEASLSRVPDVRLIVIDPISAYLGSADSHKNAEVRSLLAPIAELAQRHRVAVVVVSHLTKSYGGKAMYRATGSLAFIAAARAGHMVVADPDNADRRLLLAVKSNLGPRTTGLAYSIFQVEVPGAEDIPCIAWDPNPVTMSADQVLARELSKAEKGSEGENAAEWLRDLLNGGPVASKDVENASRDCGIAQSTLRRAKKAIGAKTKKHGFGPDAPWFWYLPGSIDAQNPIDAQANPMSAYDENGHLCSADPGNGMPASTDDSDHNVLFDPIEDPNRFRS